VHRALEAAGVAVAATATAGGVFDPEEWFLSMLGNVKTVTLRLYSSYLVVACDDVYDLYDSPFDVFRRPWASRVDRLFDMQHYFDDVVAGLAPNARARFIGPFARGLSDPQAPLRVRLRANAVDRWTPVAPVRVYHSPDDEEVPYPGALVSVERLRQAGANVVVEPIPGFDHVNSWIQAMPRAAEWFRSFD
jgi:hypothetical protein